VTDTYRIEVFWHGDGDGRAADVRGQIEHLGIESVTDVCISNLYFLQGVLTADEVERIVT